MAQSRRLCRLLSSPVRRFDRPGSLPKGSVLILIRQGPWVQLSDTRLVRAYPYGGLDWHILRSSAYALPPNSPWASQRPRNLCYFNTGTSAYPAFRLCQLFLWVGGPAG